jgi:hypothetical protein
MQIFEMRKRFSAPSLAKPRQTAAAILKTYELFIHGDIPYIIGSICKRVLK